MGDAHWSDRLVEIVGEAARKPVHEREAFVRAACADTEERGQALELLRALNEAGEFMDRPTLNKNASESLKREPEGAVIGRYTLGALLGEGGFGSVFVAEQTEPVVRTVAIKIVKLGMDTRQVVARFEAERQALAMMDHPNIAKIFDGGSTANGRPYFVMELVRGEPITRYCDMCRLGCVERLELFITVCHAVQHAHQKGIIHRDLKPSNVLVEVVDGRPVPKIIDFGIAKAIHARLTDKEFVTEHRALLGTPEYMSPEQADNGGLDIDTRSDIYSLGVLLYELLTGVTPFEPARLRSAAFAEVQRIIREVEPPKPSTRLSTMKEALSDVSAQRSAAPGRLSTQIRGDLDWIVMKCLEKDRTRRYESASGLAQDIERHLRGDSVLAAPPGARYRTVKFLRRHSFGVAAASGIFVALTVGLAFAVWQAGIAGKERDAQKTATAAAVAANEQTQLQRERTEQVAHFQASQLQDIDAVKMGRSLRDGVLSDLQASMAIVGATPEQISARQDALTKLLDEVNMTNVALGALDENVLTRSLEAVDKQFENQPLVKARLLQTLATTLRKLGLLDRAAAPQAEALVIRKRELGGEHVDTLDSSVESAMLLQLQGKLAEAEATYREAIETMRRVLGEDHRQTIGAISSLGDLLQVRGRIPEAEPLYLEAMEKSTRMLGVDDPDTISIRHNLGMMFYAQGKLREAGECFEQVVDSSRRVNGQDDERTLGFSNDLASVFQAQGKLIEAETMFRDGLARYRRTLGDEHHHTLQALNNMGHILYVERKLSEAEPYTREALERRRRVLKDDHFDTIQSINNMGLLFQDTGKLDAAELLFQEALERRRRVLGPAHQSTLQSLSSLASLRQRQGKLEGAEQIHREVLELRRETLGADHPDTMQSLNNLAVALMAQKKHELAEPLFREALEGRIRLMGKSNPNVAASQAKLGEVLTLLGRFAEAEGLLLEAEQIFSGPGIPPGRHQRCIEYLVGLYEAWDRAEPAKGHDLQVLAWKAKLSLPAAK